MLPSIPILHVQRPLYYMLQSTTLLPFTNADWVFIHAVNFVDSVIRKFMGKDANKNAKVMAFFTASNLFASAECSRVMLARRSRSMLIDHIVESINSTKKDLRLVRTPPYRFDFVPHAVNLSSRLHLAWCLTTVNFYHLWLRMMMQQMT